MGRRGTGAVEIVLRPRLVEQLAARWNHRVVVIEASGGFGKSTLLQQAIADNTEDPLGTDVLWRVGVNDVGPLRIHDRLFNHAAAALELPSVEGPGRSALDDLLLAQSPRRVCLIVDDAHRLRSDVDTLLSLIDGLPTNVSIVLSGRSMDWLPLVALQARGQVIRIGQKSMAFDPREIDEFADRNGFSAETLQSQGGWPVLATLSLSGSSPSDTTEYLLKELVSGLDVPARRGLIAATCLSGVADDLLAELGGISGQELAQRVPLSQFDDGALRVHDLWWDTRDDVFDADEVRDVANYVFRWLRSNGFPIDAALLALRIDEPDLAGDAVLDSAFVGERFLSPPVIARLLDLFKLRVDPDDPVVELLRGLLVRANPREIENASALYERAVETFRSEGNLRGEAAALIGEVDVRWTRGDSFEELFEIFTRLVKLRDLGVAALDPLEQVAPVVFHDLAGEFNEALDTCLRLDMESLTPTWANAMAIWTATLAGLCGRLDVGVSVAEELYSGSKSDLSLFALVRATFLGGDPARALAMRADGHRLELVSNDNYDAVQVATTWAIIAASWGEAVPIDELHFAPPRTREMAYEAISHAASRVASHDETAAGEGLASHLEAVGIAEPLSLGELRRWLPYPYVLSAELRELFDTEAAANSLGPDHRTSWEIAADFVAMRDGQRPVHSPPTAESLFCAMPLPWSVDYALRLADVSEEESQKLLLGLMALAGGSVAEELRFIARSDDTCAKQAMAILRSEPSTPLVNARIHTVESCEVVLGGEVVSLASTAGRVLQALTLRRSMNRNDLAAALWPDSDREKAAASLRVALSSLRKTLEPERAKGEPSFHLRADEQIATLHPSEYLSIDVWDLREAVADGRAHEAAGRSRSAAAAYGLVLAGWPRKLLSALRDVDGFIVDIEALDSDLAEAVVRYAELALSISEPSIARRAALRTLAAERFEERAYRVLIRAALQEGDRAEARRQARLCQEWFDKLGITPSADTKMTIRLTD